VPLFLIESSLFKKEQLIHQDFTSADKDKQHENGVGYCVDYAVGGGIGVAFSIVNFQSSFQSAENGMCCYFSGIF
jgi:hypothetical protein